MFRQRLASRRNMDKATRCRERLEGESSVISPDGHLFLHSHQVPTEFLNCVSHTRHRAERCSPVLNKQTGQWERPVNCS